MSVEIRIDDDRRIYTFADDGWLVPLYDAATHARPARTGYIDQDGTYHPGPSYVGFDEHAERCGSCDLLRTVADDYIDRRPAPVPSWARDVPLPIGRHLEHGDGSQVPPRRFVRIIPDMPIPGPGMTRTDGLERWRRSQPARLGPWRRFCAWFRYRAASWPTARVVQR